MVARGAAKELIHKKFSDLSKVQELVQHVALNLTTNSSSTVYIVNVVRLYAYFAIVNEALFYEQSVAQEN